MFFDERFNYIEEGSGTLRVTQAGSSNASLTLANNKAPKNGYVYVYVSNESDEMVYFDNLQVAHNRGRIIEENHYYSFGLKIAGISSKKLGDVLYEGSLENKHLYNDKELIDEADLDLYDFGFRIYDPQIGRFTQIDPLTDEMPFFSPYLFAGNEPIGNIDFEGLNPIPGLSGTWANLGEVVVKAAPKAATTTITKAGQKIGGEIIKQAFKKGGKLLLKAASLTVSFLLTPLEAGNARPAGPAPAGKVWGGDQWVTKPTYTTQPYSPPNDNPKSPQKPDEEDDNNNKYLYRFDTRTPAEIAKAGGFKAWGSNFNVREHVTGKSIKNKTSGYVSTSKTRQGALGVWKGRKNGYLYKIKYQLTGRDVSHISPFPQQQEVIVPGAISATDIVDFKNLSKSN